MDLDSKCLIAGNAIEFFYCYLILIYETRSITGQSFVVRSQEETSAARKLSHAEIAALYGTGDKEKK